MAYNDVPLATQRIKDSQAPIRQNFQDIQTDFSVNHVPIDDPSGNGGKQQFIQFPNVHVDADVLTAAGEVALLTKTGLTSVPALFFRGQSNATVPSGGFTEFQGGPGPNVANGWTRLPSGILIKWGFVAPSLPNPGTITFPTGASIPAFSDIFTVTLSMRTGVLADPDTFATIVGISATFFQVWQSARTTVSNKATQFNYIAIGT